MAGSYVAELFKMIKRPAVWVVCTVWLTLLLVFTELFPYLAYRSASTPKQADRLLAPLLPSQLPGHVITGYPVWGGALILVLGALCWGSEYGWGTLKTMLSNRPGRLTLFVVQVAGLATAVAILVIVGFALCSLASLAIAGSAGASLDPPTTDAMAQAMAAGWLILMMWGLLGVSLAIGFRGTALPIGLGLVWILAIENLIRFTAPLIDVLGQVEKVLPGVDAGSLVAALGAASAGNTGVAAVVGGAQALWSVALYATLFAIAGAVMLRRRDVQ
jgi:ABC-2 type transport system permease protein